MSMTPEKLSRLRELCEKATPPPWEYNEGRSIDTPPIHADEANYGIPDKGFEGGYQFYCSADDGAWKYADGDFIAAARTALPQLLDEVERLQNFHEELNNLRINIENMAGQSSDEWKSSGLEAVATMLRMWFLEEGQERKQAIRRQASALNEANKLLEQTIEVLEEFEMELGTSESLGELMAAWTLWRITKAKPLLDNLKARKKEGEKPEDALAGTTPTPKEARDLLYGIVGPDSQWGGTWIRAAHTKALELAPERTVEIERAFMILLDEEARES